VDSIRAGIARAFKRRPDDDREEPARGSSQRTGKRLTTAEYIVHQEVTRRYLDLINQELLDAVISSGSLDADGEALARSWLARVLFLPEHVRRGRRAARKVVLKNGGVDIARNRFSQLWQAGKEVRAAAERSGHQHAWVFESAEGRTLDESRQQAYEGCDPRGPIEFVVAPGYVVDGDKLYVKQVVFTKPARQPRRA
jgi:hypothetical protein